MICEMINKGQGARVRGQGNETVSLRALVSLRVGNFLLRKILLTKQSSFSSRLPRRFAPRKDTKDGYVKYEIRNSSFKQEII